MKKILSILLVAVIMLSFITVSTGLAVSAEGAEDEIPVTDTVSEDETSPAETDEDSYAMTFEALKIMGFGMLGIFIVTGILVIIMYLLCLIKEKNA